jgi:PPP family 3-phenylpropionic acid transporter
VVTLASGPLYDRLGGDGFYVMAVIAVVGLALIVAARFGPQPQRAGSGGETSEPR